MKNQAKKSVFLFSLIQVLEGLKEQYSKIILLDMLGYGFSDKPVSY